jgi:hypothetical protein
MQLRQLSRAWVLHELAYDVRILNHDRLTPRTGDISLSISRFKRAVSTLNLAN